MNKFAKLITGTILIAFLASCSVLNNFVPLVDVPEGALGFGGATGTELAPSSFQADSAALSTLAQSATFSFETKFDDLDLKDADVDIKGLDQLVTVIGLAAPNNVVVKLSKPTNNDFPETITLTKFDLTFSLSDAANSVNSPVAGIPESAEVTLNLTKGTDNADGTVNYVIDAAEVDKLKMFKIDIAGAVAQSAGKVVLAGGENTVKVSLTITSSNNDLDGAQAIIRIGETGTQVKAQIF